MAVGVVIPCRNEAATVGSLLDALAAQEQQPDLVVVVDDGSTDGTAGTIERWRSAHAHPPVRLLPNAGRGIAAAVNTGVRALGTDLIVRLDGHCRPARDYVRRLSLLAAAPDVGVAGGAWEIAPGAGSAAARAIALAGSHPFGSGGAAYRHPRRSDPLTTDTVPFGCFRRRVWESLGGYDESLGANEDYEFNWRARRSGLRVVLDPSVRCTYLARATLGALARQYFRYGRWKAVVLRRQPLSLRLRQLAPAGVVAALGVSLALAVLRPDARWLLVVAGYAAVLGIAAGHATVSARSAGPGRHGAGVVLWLPVAAAFATAHVAWGLGFWAALVRPPDAPRAERPRSRHTIV